tara:strand:- start:36680 stop:36826 length:147 start_codon:yes stop_codon:yes gene_type:complete
MVRVAHWPRRMTTNSQFRPTSVVKVVFTTWCWIPPVPGPLRPPVVKGL